jgi:hypothetical protein
MSLRSEITKDQWAEWRLHPVTRAFFEAVEAQREEHIDLLPKVASPIRQNQLVGVIGAYSQIMRTDFSEE